MRTAIILFAILCIPTFAFTATIYVPDDYPLIQQAINASKDGDTVIVKPGTYVENIDFAGRAATVKSAGGASLTIIDGNQMGSVVTCRSGEGPDSVLEGFTIKNGDALFGGGMHNDSASPTISSCIFADNSATYGGGMYNYYCQGPVVINCVFMDNGSEYGGGMRNWYSDPSVINCLFIRNKSIYDQGAGMANYSSDPILTNDTFYGNRFGAIENSFDSNSKLTNCILWCDYVEITNANSYPIVTWSCIQGGWPGEGNIDSDPLLVDPEYGDFHLTYLSPCRNSGDNDVVTVSEDFESDPRIAWGGTVDMGVDEFYTHLYVTGDFTPAGSIEGKFVGLPGTSTVGLFLGFDVLDPPVSTAWGNFYLQPPVFLIPLIPIPANGVLQLPAMIPASPTAPYDLPMQALIGLNPDSLTNLFVLEVR
jgi:hypothetical protein